ncbi:major facilitator superfamily domain-containing protein [Apodospora peruviana]|uniref:Major facilitator superfamily domain-containing protein n=1 Tax=Apodospora peruviana TaxID=516989 RepID=A0AAE0MG96_9PEZI|nr:major facilitator superfamily domain-containing protein [Apodospora peruviana]
MATAADGGERPQQRSRLSFFPRISTAGGGAVQEKSGPPKWNMGMLNDKETIEVPGSVLLLAPDHNEPLGLRNAPARTSHSSLPTGIPHPPPETPADERKKTNDGKIILEPQPEDSANDPLNWPAWRRDAALLSLGLFCMLGGGTTPILAAGFTNVANDFDVSVSDVSLTTGLYMMGMGLGSVIFSPTAILWGKRPVYLFGAFLFVITSVWCAVSPNFTSLVLARIFQGVAVSPVECLPSATIAEIFFLHERAFRIGIYTLLLLGGKNLVPLVSAAIMDRLEWRWVFWILAIIVGFCGFLLFLFVPETFWDRVPHAKKPRVSSSRPSFFRRYSSKHQTPQLGAPTTPAEVTHHSEPIGDVAAAAVSPPPPVASSPVSPSPVTPHRVKHAHHVGFAPDPEIEAKKRRSEEAGEPSGQSTHDGEPSTTTANGPPSSDVSSNTHVAKAPTPPERIITHPAQRSPAQHSYLPDTDSESQSVTSPRTMFSERQPYTAALREQPPRSFIQQLKPFHGRLNQDKWHKVAIRPLILFSYPAVLWSAIVYSCSVGWLIVISESVAVIFREGHYEFDALQTGLVYISPFIGGILGTAVAGKVSDVIVKAMARRNGGLYEPEFRLVMAIPVAITTVIGLMGFGWSAQLGDHWIVPTAFFGIVSFGCSLGSTTSITFCVDSYRQYAGEALVTLNFSKNIFHGLVFSLFVTGWLTADGPKTVYIWIGVIQLILLFATIPMYIYGKRARMWTVRKNFMEKF